MKTEKNRVWNFENEVRGGDKPEDYGLQRRRHVCGKPF